MTNVKTLRKIPSPLHLQQTLVLSDDVRASIVQHRKEIKAILSGNDDRLLIVVGPCSAWPSDAVLEYASRLKQLQQRVSDRLKLVLRTYVQKPRTTVGWKGPLNQPHPLKPPSIIEGLHYGRKLMLDVVNMGVPVADEALFIQHSSAFTELLSYVAVGARSTQNQEHRMFASGLHIPVGMKNPTCGDVVVAVQSMLVAQHGHHVAFDGHEIETLGNEFAHVILRGGLVSGPNYHADKLLKTIQAMDVYDVSHPAIIVDVSHDNCRVDGKKDHLQQRVVLEEIIRSLHANKSVRSSVKGFMIESFLKEGKQTIDEAHPEHIDMGGLSITDPCLGWEQTEDLLIDLAKSI